MPTKPHTQTNPPAQQPPVWLQWCDAARGIGENFGADKAREYLLEKFMTFIGLARQYPAYEPELPKFAAEVRTILSHAEIEGHLKQMARGRYRPYRRLEILKRSENEDATFQRQMDRALWLKDLEDYGRMRELLGF